MGHHSIRDSLTMRIALIACGKTKLPHPAPARDLYTGNLFRKSWQYAARLGWDHAYILSAEHGLVLPDAVLDPYDKTLAGAKVAVRRKWAEGMLRQLSERHDINESHFVILAGSAYRQYLVPYLTSWEAPLAGLGLGEQLAFLKRALQ